MRDVPEVTRKSRVSLADHRTVTASALLAFGMRLSMANAFSRLYTPTRPPHMRPISVVAETAKRKRTNSLEATYISITIYLRPIGSAEYITTSPRTICRLPFARDFNLSFVGSFDDAAYALRCASRLSPEDGDVLYRAGVCAINQGRWSR